MSQPPSQKLGEATRSLWLGSYLEIESEAPGGPIRRKVVPRRTTVPSLSKWREPPSSQCRYPPPSVCGVGPRFCAGGAGSALLVLWKYSLVLKPAWYSTKMPGLLLLRG